MKKQFRYAFGEIFIVIVGITIAFSLNKCAEDSKNQRLLKQYLTNLKQDIEADKILLESNLEALEKKINLCDEILPKLNVNSQNKRSIIGKLFSVASLSSFDPKDITYQTLINSGDLNLIEDFEVKAAIEQHYSDYKIMLKAYERQENIHKEYLGNYFIHNTDYDKIAKGEFGFSDEKLLKNIIQSMKGSFIIKDTAIKKGILSCDALIDTLDKSLE